MKQLFKISLLNLPWKNILAIAIVSSMVVTAMIFKYNSPIKSIEVEIEGLPVGRNLINANDIKLTLEKEFGTAFEGWAMKDVDVELIEELLTKSPFIKEVNVYVDAMNRLTMNIEQREPILRVQDENGMSFYIDQEGFRVPISNHYAARVQVATGFIPRFNGRHIAEANGVYKSLYTVAKTIGSDPFFNALVEQIFVDEEGKLILSPKVGGQKIVIGGIDELKEKLEKLRNFMTEGLAYEGWTKYDVIDLRFKEQVVCRKTRSKLSVNYSFKE